MSVTTAASAREEESEFYVWSFPGAPVEIHLRLDVVRRLEGPLQQTVNAGAADTRGLLLGRLDTLGVPEILDFQPLSTTEPAELEAAMANVKNSAGGLVSLGYYRTHREEGLCLSAHDLSLAQAFFSDPNCVLLLIQPSAADPAKAGFFYWDRGKLNGGFYDFCFLEFPFDASSLASPEDDKDPHAGNGTPAIITPAPATSEYFEYDLPTEQSLPAVVEPRENDPGAPAQKLTPASPVPENKSSPRPNSHFWRAVPLGAVAIFIAIIGLGSGVFFFVSLKPTLPVPSGTLFTGLNVSQHGSDLVVLWNRDSTPVASADTGKLIIHDGTVRELLLNKDFIRSGSIVYVPQSDQVRIQLDLNQPDQRVVSESVTVILHRP